MESNTNTYLETIDFSDLSIWDVKNLFNNIDLFNPKYRIVVFGEFLNKPNIDKIKIQDEKTYKILGVRSYGKGAYINRTVNGSTLKMRTYQLAKENHLYWCKVDTKNGAFGIINKDLADGVASSNMTFAEVNSSKALIEYVQLLFKSKKVNAYMDGYVVGTTNRKYIKPDQLLNEIKIPLPNISEQKRITKSYYNKITLAENQEQKIKQIEREIENYLFDEIGISKLKKQETKKGLQFTEYKNLTNWFPNNIFGSTSFNSIKYKTISLNDKPSAFIELFRGKSPRYSSNSVEKILNQKCIRWNNIEIEYAKTVDKYWLNKVNENNLTKINDILINSTGEGTIGRASLIKKGFETLLYDSHILLLRLDKELICPLFFVYLFNSKYGQKQVDNIKSAQTTKQTELGINNLKNILLPLPPLSQQKIIAKRIEELKEEIIRLTTEAKENREQAIKEFENEIF